MTCSLAREPSDEQMGFNRLKSASVSRVPCKKSIGIGTLAKCSARLVPGLLGGCNGNPKNTRPRTPSKTRCDAACELILAPKDLPPANKGRPAAAVVAVCTAAATVAAATAGEYGTGRLCSMYRT